MSSVIETLEGAIVLAEQRREEQAEFIQKWKDEFIRIANGLEIIAGWLVRMEIDGSGSMDISVAGDHHVFNGLWGALRKLGYQCENRPDEKKISGWSGWFYNSRQEHRLALYISFASTKCSRKKVGTKMVQQDVYEIVCE